MTSASRLILLSVVAVTAACSAPAERPLAPEDFARGVEISPGPGPFFRAELPAYVFPGTAWPDLRDIAVFNRAGEPVPFARVTPARAEGELKRVPLRTFRLESMTTGGAPQIQLDTQGRGVELRVSPARSPQIGVEYLLATSLPDLETPIRRLLLEWEEREANWRQYVTVSVSSDLESWRTVALSRPLMDLRTADGSRLQHAEIVVEPEAPEAARYWRLQFRAGDAPVLTSVEGETRAAAPELSGVPLPVNGPVNRNGAAEYELTSPQPVARIRITPADENSVFPLLVEIRESDDGPWISLTRTVAYRLNAAGSGQFSDPVEIGGRLVKTIRLRPLGTSWGASMPQLDLERDPLTLVVNARGAGPFLLAWGNRASSDNAVPFGELVPNLTSDRLLEIPPGRINAEARTLGGDARLTDPGPGARAARWQTTLVWLVLVGGALALALLAFRVWRESQLHQNETGS